MSESLDSFRADWRRMFAGQELAWMVRKAQRFMEEAAAEAVRNPAGLAADELVLDELRDYIRIKAESLKSEAQRQMEIAFFKPSYEQALALNAWHPDNGGHRSVCIFSAVRSGKTVSSIINNLLWMLPNDSSWPCFEPYVDEMGREVKLLRRPMFDYWQRSGRMSFSDTEPPKGNADVWQGVVDENHWRDKIEPVYRRYMPPAFIGQSTSGAPKWLIAEKAFETKWGGRVSGKLYASEMAAWSGKELFCIALDEGPPADKLREVIFRTHYFFWAYTPRDSANLSDRAKLAYEVYRRNPSYPLPGQDPLVLIHGMDVVPSHIMSREKREERIRMAQAMGEKERTAIHGGFFLSSPSVFTNFDRKRNVLPVTGDVVLRAIKAESRPDEIKQWPWLPKLEGANIVRGVDDGIVHASTCAWSALLKTGEQVVFMEWKKTGLAVRQRVQEIVALSGNSLEPLEWGRTHEEVKDLRADQIRSDATGENVRRMREKQTGMSVRRSFLDSKSYKRDPNFTDETFAENYRRAGLNVEPAVGMLPRQRCDMMNDMFAPDTRRMPLAPCGDVGGEIAGARLYITMDCVNLIEEIESALWQEFKAGDKRGELTGNPVDKGDDVLDSAQYATLHGLRWADMSEIAARRAA